MENLVNKSVTFEGLFEIMDKDHGATFDFIFSLKNKEIQERLCDEARDYYAKFYNVKKEDVGYGNLTGNQIPKVFPYSHFIGHLKDIVNKDMSKLVHIAGSIKNSFIEEYPNLETIGFGDFSGSNLKRLPKLRKAYILSVSYTPLEDIQSLELVERTLNCRGTNIQKVNPNLEIMGKLYCENSNHFEEKLDKSKKHNWWYTDNPNIL